VPHFRLRLVRLVDDADESVFVVVHVLSFRTQPIFSNSSGMIICRVDSISGGAGNNGIVRVSDFAPIVTVSYTPNM
jgi:hypothetical protein